MTKPRLVLDANVPIDMVRERNPDSDAVMRAVFDGQADMLLSPKLWGEYQTGLWHPESLDSRSADYIQKYVDAIAERALYFEKIPYQVALKGNRKDEHIVNLAVYHDADFIVTRDTGLLKLANHPDWNEWFPATKVIHPEAFSHELSLWQERQQQLEQQQAVGQSRGPSLSL